MMIGILDLPFLTPSLYISLFNGLLLRLKNKKLSHSPFCSNWHFIVRHPRRENSQKNVNDKLQGLYLLVILWTWNHMQPNTPLLTRKAGRQAGTGNKSREIVYCPTDWLTDWLGGRKEATPLWGYKNIPRREPRNRQRQTVEHKW